MTSLYDVIIELRKLVAQDTERLCQMSRTRMAGGLCLMEMSDGHRRWLDFGAAALPVLERFYEVSAKLWETAISSLPREFAVRMLQCVPGQKPLPPRDE